MKYVGLLLLRVVEFPSAPLVLGIISLGVGALIPQATHSETARRVGRGLIWSGAILTIMALLGFVASIFIKIDHPRF